MPEKTYEEGVRDGIQKVIDKVTHESNVWMEVLERAKDYQTKDLVRSKILVLRDLMDSLIQDNSVPDGEIHFVAGSDIVGKIINIGSGGDAADDKTREGEGNDA